MTKKLGVEFAMDVGNTLDMMAGKVNRAPKCFQYYVLEWFYQIIQEPRRMWNVI